MKLVDVHNTRQGQPAVIIGSGPSILKTDLGLLSSSDVVSVGINRMWKPEIAERGLSKLDFLAFTDTKVMNDMKADAPQSYDRLAELGGAWLRWTRNHKSCPQIFDHAPEILDFADTGNGGSGHQRIPVLGMETRGFIEGQIDVPYVEPRHRAHAPGLTVSGSTVACAFHLALVLGCDPIILVGVDAGMQDQTRRHFFTDTPDERLRHERTAFKNGAAEVPIQNSADKNFLVQYERIYQEWSPHRTLINATVETNVTSWPRASLADALALETNRV